MIALSVAIGARVFAVRLFASLTVLSFAQAWMLSALCQPVPAAVVPVTAGTTIAQNGTLCLIRVMTAIDSQSARVGAAVEATLSESLLMTETYNAPPGSRVLGRIAEIDAPRTQAQSALSSDRRLKTDSSLGIVFEEIICPDGQCFRINGRLAKQKKVVPLASGHIRTISVNGEGQLVTAKEALSVPERARNIVFQNALQLATLATGGASLVIAPVALGAVGAVSPTFASNRPVDPQCKHPRLKGFLDGVVDAIPGAPVVQAFVVHGDKTGLLAGDELLMSCAPLSGNVLLPPGVQTGVHGVVLQKGSETAGSP